MKFTLIQNQQVSLTYWTTTNNANFEQVCIRRTTLPNTAIPQKLQKQIQLAHQNDKVQKNAHYGSVNAYPNLENYRLSSMIIEVELSSPRHNSYNRIPGNVNTIKGLFRAMDNRALDLFDTLHKLYGDRCKLQVDLLNLKAQNYSTGDNWSIKDLDTTLCLLQNKNVWGAESSFELDNSNFTSQYWLSSSYDFTGSLTITLTIPDDSKVDNSVKDKLSIVKKILKDEVASDVIIVAKNGVHVKCHKNFLFAQSPVLETMFQSSMKEGQTGSVEILDMEEQSVRAFLAYLYFWDVENAQKSSLIAFELLHAGHKYDIPTLENCMKNILLGKEPTWYDVDVAMRLFLFSRNLANLDELKMKAIEVLKLNFSKLEKSQCYQQLFKKNPKAAMDLCKYAFNA